MITSIRSKTAGPLTTALLSTAAASLLLSGCARVDTTSPAEARQHPAAEKSDGKSQSKPAPGAGRPDCRKAKCVALTFDAGPSENTPRLLRILKREDVHATFFLLGKKHITRHPDLVRRIADQGHEVANHTWSHGILTDLGDDDVRDEISRVQRRVRQLTGTTPRLMRPPQGRTDEHVSKLCRELGVAQVLWSVTAKDYKTTDSALIRKRVLDQTDRDGIILLHDIYKGTVPAVPGIIKALKKKGYTFVTVPELLAPGAPEPGKVYRP
ncbi:polysaccharide deacetylase family protein [Streptomyces sp. SB3404]|uniref:Polysaccharide deacetylase family protein n=1 Tax=Streptomyces boncukensis TaxID=2711219 RepID=A0A6G4WVJ9_9ACTN|nr:polysaccharide deacetylase family protein [Streptomyces boncukensis]NGO69138.1 polysaccharide deacetylase family protein [Streptomyces boncukensis]